MAAGRSFTCRIGRPHRRRDATRCRVCSDVHSGRRLVPREVDPEGRVAGRCTLRIPDPPVSAAGPQDQRDRQPIPNRLLLVPSCPPLLLDLAWRRTGSTSGCSVWPNRVTGYAGGSVRLRTRWPQHRTIVSGVGQHHHGRPARKQSMEVYIVSDSAVLWHLIDTWKSVLRLRGNAVLGITAATLMAGCSPLVAHRPGAGPPGHPTFARAGQPQG